MTSFHLKDSTINYRWLLTSRQRTRRDKTDAEADTGIQPMRGSSAPPQTPTKALWGPAQGTDHFSHKDSLLLPGLSLPVQASAGASLTDGKTPHPPLQTPSFLFPIMSQNQAAFESFISKKLRISWFFNDEIIRSVKKLRCCGWYRHKVTDSARQQLRRSSEAAEATPSPEDCPLSFHQASFQPPRRQRAFYYPNRPSYLQPTSTVLQPPAWKRKSRFSLPKRHKEPSSKLRRAKARRIFLNKNWHNTLTLCACHMTLLELILGL